MENEEVIKLEEDIAKMEEAEIVEVAETTDNAEAAE